MQPPIVKTDKYTRYLICHKRGGIFAKDGMVKYSGNGPKGNIVYAYEYSDKIIFRALKYSVCAGKMTSDKKTFIFKEKKNRYNLYSVSNAQNIRNCSNIPTRIDEIFSRFKNGNVGKNKARLILKNFLKKKGLKNKIKNPASMILGACYPALLDLNGFLPLKGTRGDLRSAFSICFKEKTFRESVRKCFGVSGDAIFKAVINDIKERKSFDCFFVGALLKNILSPNDILDFIKNADKKVSFSRIGDAKSVTKLRNLFKFYHKDRLKILIDKDFNTCCDFITLDSAKMLSEYKEKIQMPEKPKSFDEIHECLKNQIKKLKVEIKKFGQEKIAKLDGQVIGDMTIILPKDNHELIDWGNQMNNCIASYWRSVENGETNVMGVLKNGNLTYNIEIRNLGIRQFVAKFNQPPEAKDKEIISKYLIDNKICIEYGI